MLAFMPVLIILAIVAIAFIAGEIVAARAEKARITKRDALNNEAARFNAIVAAKYRTPGY